MNTDNKFIIIGVRIIISLLTSCTLLLKKPEIPAISIIGISLFIYFTLEFNYKLGKDLPVLQLIILIALIQWIIAPVLSYHIYTESEFYYMAIPEVEYMNFILPSAICFIVGLIAPQYFIQHQSKIETGYESNPSYYFKAGRFILIIGIISVFAAPLVPKSLHYLFYLLSNLTIIGSFYIIYSRHKQKFLYLIIAIVPTILITIQEAVFHDLFIWGGFILIMYSYIAKSTIIQKNIFLGITIILVISINSIKGDFRTILWGIDSGELTIEKETQLNTLKNNNLNNNTQKLDAVNIFSKLISAEVIQSEKEQKKLISDNQAFVDRLNQGWIIARILNQVPSVEPFANGETIKEGLYASIVPRFLDANKAKSGGGKYFERFTGTSLGGASMNLGLVGEAYVNYGTGKGFIFMGLYGLFFSLTFLYIKKKTQKKIELAFWIPFLFFYVIKAEEDFSSIMNQFVKSIIVMQFILYIKSQFIKEKISSTKKLNNFN